MAWASESLVDTRVAHRHDSYTDLSGLSRPDSLLDLRNDDGVGGGRGSNRRHSERQPRQMLKDLQAGEDGPSATGGGGRAAASSGQLRQLAESYMDDSLLKVERDLLLARISQAADDKASAEDAKRLMEVQQHIQRAAGGRRGASADHERNATISTLSQIGGGGGGGGMASLGSMTSMGGGGSNQPKRRDAASSLASRLDSLGTRLDASNDRRQQEQQQREQRGKKKQQQPLEDDDDRGGGGLRSVGSAAHGLTSLGSANSLERPAAASSPEPRSESKEPRHAHVRQANWETGHRASTRAGQRGLTDFVEGGGLDGLAAIIGGGSGGGGGEPTTPSSRTLGAAAGPSSSGSLGAPVRDTSTPSRKVRGKGKGKQLEGSASTPTLPASGKASSSEDKKSGRKSSVLGMLSRG